MLPLTPPSTGACPDVAGTVPGSLSLDQVRDLTAAWILEGEISMRSPRTIEERKALGDKLLWFLRRECKPECGVDEMRAFLAYVASGHLRREGRWCNAVHAAACRPVKPSTVAAYHRNLRAMLRWGIQAGEIEEYPLRGVSAPRVQRDQVVPFTEQQVSALLSACKRTRWPKRAAALVLFMLDTGARRGEVCALRPNDVDLVNRRCYVVGKGKRRMLPIGLETTSALRAYQSERSSDAECYFVAGQGDLVQNALSGSGLHQFIQQLGKMAGIEGVRCSPHTFRHTFAIEFLRSGGSELALQQLLGHASLAMIRRYVMFTAADIHAQHARHSPADRIVRKHLASPLRAGVEDLAQF